MKLSSMKLSSMKLVSISKLPNVIQNIILHYVHDNVLDDQFDKILNSSNHWGNIIEESKLIPIIKYLVYFKIIGKNFNYFT